LFHFFTFSFSLKTFPFSWNRLCIYQTKTVNLHVHTVESRYREHAYLDFLVISTFSWCPNFFSFLFYINQLRLSRISISRLFRYLEVIFCTNIYVCTEFGLFISSNISPLYLVSKCEFSISTTHAALDYRVIMFFYHYACVKCCASLTLFCLQVRIFNFYRPYLPCRGLRLFSSKVNWPLCTRSIPHVINTWVKGVKSTHHVSTCNYDYVYSKQIVFKSNPD